MGNAADVKGPGPFGCLLMALFLGYILWQFAGCGKTREPERPSASRERLSASDYERMHRKLNTPDMRAMARNVIIDSGNLCPTVSSIRTANPNADLRRVSRYDLIVTCDSNFGSGEYDVSVDGDGRNGRVRLRR